METATLIRNRERSRLTPIIFLTAFSTSDNLCSEGIPWARWTVFKLIEPEILTSKVAVFVDQKTAEIKRQATQLAAVNAELEKVKNGFALCLLTRRHFLDRY